MLTRRENLLIRPWQQRRFQSHRRKVHSALPAIDASAPAERNHVAHKLKKVQREEERVFRIESDNVRLLQRMAAIMRTSRLDNRWITEPPGSFLGRIGIYAPPPSSTTSRRDSMVSEEPPVTAAVVGRKASCSACALKRLQQEQQAQLDIQKSAPPRDVEKLPKVKPADRSKKKKSRRLSAPSCSEPWTPPEWAASSRVVLTRGQLQVSVAYPAHTAVQVERAGCTPLVLETEFCSCAAKLPPSAAC